MEVTSLIKLLDDIREPHAQPKSYIQILREMAMYPQPPMFTEEQRHVLVSNLDFLRAFLQSEDGADAVELLMDSFRCYVQQQETVVEEEQLSK